MKPGYQTSQLWMTAMTVAAGVLNRKLGLGLTLEELALLCSLVGGYVAHRHFAYKHDEGIVK